MRPAGAYDRAPIDRGAAALYADEDAHGLAQGPPPEEEPEPASLAAPSDDADEDVEGAIAEVRRG